MGVERPDPLLDPLLDELLDPLLDELPREDLARAWSAA